MNVTPETGDRELMARFCSRADQAAFEQLVGRWDRRVLGFLAKACGDLDAAEDLRQEVFIRVYRYSRSYNPSYAFSTWLFRIATNALKTWRTRQGRRREVSVEAIGAEGRWEPADPAPDPRERLASSESGDRVRATIAELPPQSRELLLLRFDVGLNYRQIGEVLEAPETTVKSRLYRLLAELRGQMSAEHLGARKEKT